MQLRTFRHLWGVNEPLEQATTRFQARGYHGLESHFGDAAARRAAGRILEGHGMQNIAMVFTHPDPVVSHTLQAHLQSLERGLSEALETSPVGINVHAGWDAWSETETLHFFEAALEQVSRLPIPVGFETHRGRCLNTPWSTLKVLEHFPEMRLTLDVSHWVVVCERLPDDQCEALERAVQATIHLHARIGSEQAPQVNDPRAPEHARLLEWYKALWNRVWNAGRARGDRFATLTPEFGPPDYQPTRPYTQEPLSDVETVCDWMARRQLERFGAD